MSANSVAFDNEKYLEEQTKAILERVGRFDNKLYLEFGGKLVFDHHASRVLPGFDPNVKMRLLNRGMDRTPTSKRNVLWSWLPSKRNRAPGKATKAPSSARRCSLPTAPSPSVAIHL